jgi:hypothetical protein
MVLELRETNGVRRNGESLVVSRPGVDEWSVVAGPGAVARH